MKRHTAGRFLGAALALVVLVPVVLVVASGCASTPIAQRPGAQLWGENCGRCHNVRPPETLDDAQWAVVVRHMRTRANLSGDEERKILEFLQASN